MTTTLTHRIQDERLAAGLTLILAAVGLAFANFVTPGDNGGPAEYVVMLGLVAVVAATLFGRVLPNAENPSRAGWLLGAGAILSCLFFWTGLPFVLGIGAVYSGARAGKAGPMALGGFAVAAALVGCVIG